MASDDEIDAVIAGLAHEIEESIIEFVTEVVAILSEETPFRTGHARANWIPTIGQPTRETDTSVGRQQSGLAAILSYKLVMGDVYITNNVPYIGRLNSGWSAQAPAQYVEACVERALTVVNARTRSV